VLRSIQKLPKNFEGIEMPKPDFWVLHCSTYQNTQRHTHMHTHTHTHTQIHTHTRLQKNAGKVQCSNASKSVKHVQTNIPIRIHTRSLPFSHTHTHLLTRVHTYTKHTLCIIVYDMYTPPWIMDKFLS